MTVLILGGTHGVEPQSSEFVDCLIKVLDPQITGKIPAIGLETIVLEEIKKKGDYAAFAHKHYYQATSAYSLNKHLNTIKEKVNLIAVPRLNPYGLLRFTRGNGNKVDLNRNLPASNWEASELITGVFKNEENPYYPGKSGGSEIENKVLLNIIEALNVNLIFSFHTNHFIKHRNSAQINYDGAGRLSSLARSIAKECSLEFTNDIGYETPGSLGSYAKDQALDCITVEFEDTMSTEQIVKLYLDIFKQYIEGHLVGNY
jgi:protein MpaA